MKRHLRITGILIFLLFANSLSTNCQVSFEKMFSHSTEELLGNTFVNTNDGGTITIGNKFTQTQTARKYFLSKISSSYVPQWSMFYSAAFPMSLVPVDVIQMQNNDYLVTGNIQDSSNLSNNRMFLMRTDSLGNIRYVKTYADTSNPNLGMDVPMGIERISDSTYFIFAHVWGNIGSIGVYKVNASGQMLEVKYFLGNYWSHTVDPTQAIQLQNGDFFITADYDEWYDTTQAAALIALCIDSSLNIRWQKTIQSPHYLVSWDAFVDASGNIVLINFYDTIGTMKPFLTKISQNGDVLWSRAFTNTPMFTSIGTGCAVNNSYVISGYLDAPFLLITDTSGNIISKQYLFGSEEIGGAMEMTPRNNSLLILANIDLPGQSDFAHGLILTDSLFQTECSSDSVPYMTGTIQISDTAKTYVLTANYIEADITSSISTTSFNMSSTDICFTSGISSLENSESYPRVTGDRTTLNVNIPVEAIGHKITIHDIMGKEIKSNIATDENTSIDVSGLSSGVYFISMQSLNKHWSQKIILY